MKHFEHQVRAGTSASRDEVATKGPDIAPLERLVPPPHLSGRDGAFRCKNEPCRVDVDSDLEAIQWWIKHTSQTEETARQRRTAMEKLLNWAYFERCKAISAFEAHDFAAFYRFLADPHPIDRWIYPGRSGRDSATWRPFRKVLGPSARRAMMANVSSLVNWMTLQRYANLNCSFGTRVMNDGFALCASAEVGNRRVDAEQCLTVEEWRQIRHTLDEMYPSEEVTSHRLIIELLYYGGYHVNDIAKFSQKCVAPPNRVIPCWTVYGAARPASVKRLLYAPPPLADTLARWTAASKPAGSDSVHMRHNAPSTPLLDMDVVRMRRQANQVIHHAAQRALGRGSVEVGLRLGNRSLIAFRRAFDLHQRSAGDNPAAYDLTGSLDFRPDIELWAHGLKAVRPCWDWSHAAHLWTSAAPSVSHADD